MRDDRWGQGRHERSAIERCCFSTSKEEQVRGCMYHVNTMSAYMPNLKLFIRTLAEKEKRMELYNPMV